MRRENARSMSTEATDTADLNADPLRIAHCDTQDMPWRASPSGTVWRKPLFRRGGEYGPVTGLVRYAPGGAFAPHAHPQGEEILVLDGVFSDEQGDYPAGSFLFNPDGSRHAPRSGPGCELLVRLRQYPGEDRGRQVLDTASVQPRPLPQGGDERLLYAEGGHPERVALQRRPDGSRWAEGRSGLCTELFVLAGQVAVQGLEPVDELASGGWLRLPPGVAATLSAQGAVALYRRVGPAL
jgi:quercetin dioxygenase-like cupin family protein